ncbi:hypothetical protein BFP70_05185 [Thioclava sp. SK-1]|nr:hypothetical protein BFP70_05185 [Thioclava sp. SK-1]
MHIYGQHFGMSQRPFSLLPDPDFLYLSPAHSKAATLLRYSIESRTPITVMTGITGSGKTTILRHMMRDLPADTTPILLQNAARGSAEILRWIMQSLGVQYTLHLPQNSLVDQFEGFLARQLSRGKHTVLIVDEAQHLDRAALETLRLMTNINVGKRELIQLVLAGQPDLGDRLRQEDMAHFTQRIGVWTELCALHSRQTAAYIDHRLQVAGAQPGLFTPQAKARIHAMSGGIPRLINQICDLTLVYAYTDLQMQIDRDFVDTVMQEAGTFIFALAGHTDADTAPGTALAKVA